MGPRWSEKKIVSSFRTLRERIPGFWGKNAPFSHFGSITRSASMALFFSKISIPSGHRKFFPLYVLKFKTSFRMRSNSQQILTVSRKSRNLGMFAGKEYAKDEKEINFTEVSISWAISIRISSFGSLFQTCHAKRCSSQRKRKLSVRKV